MVFTKGIQSGVAIKLWSDPTYRETQLNARKDWDYGRFRGHRHTKESRMKTSASVKKYYEQHPEKFKKSDEHKQKLRLQHLGMTASEETKRKMSINNGMKNPEFRKKWFKSIHLKPNRQEQLIITWLEENKLPFSYTGDGAFFIGFRNPDFKHNNLQKVIEFNGFYTHTKQQEVARRQYFARRGYGVMFIHYDDLNDKEKTVRRIERFGGVM